MELIEFKREKLIKNINNSYFFQFNQELKDELINFINTAEEDSLDVFSGIYNFALEKYERFEMDKILNIYKTHDEISLLTKGKIEEISGLEKVLLEKKLDLL